MYIIKKLWVDPMENRDAYGYDLVGFVDTKEEADKICNSSFIPKSKYPWPLNYANEFPGDSVPEYIQQKIDEMPETKQ